jgi:hypothetical protein
MRVGVFAKIGIASGRLCRPIAFEEHGAREGNSPGFFTGADNRMAEQDGTGEDHPVAVSGVAAEFIAGALTLRKQAQDEYAKNVLKKLSEIAMDDNAGTVQVSAMRELLEQMLGRPMPPMTVAAQQNEDIATLAAKGAELRKKLDRIAQSEAAPAAAGDPE